VAEQVARVLQVLVEVAQKSTGDSRHFWTTKHPLLSQFASKKASLRVTIAGRTRAECGGVLLDVHRQSVDGWIDFDRQHFVSVICR
jgi:hypothetical protein